MMIKVNQSRCLRCGACVRDCVVEVLKPGPDEVPVLAPELERFCLNCQHCLAVCPVGALTCHDVAPEVCAPPGVLPGTDQMLHLIRQRRSIRQYQQENLDRATLATLKASLAWAPTGCNDHRLFFTVIEDKTEMDFFRNEVSSMLKFLIKTGIMRLIYPNFRRYVDGIMTGQDMVFRNAPHMIVASTPKNAPCREADPWIALSYFDLLAQTSDVGTCWCGFAVHAFRWNRKLRKKLNLPPGYKVGAVMLFGKPDVTYARATAPAEYQINSLTGCR